MNLTPGEQLAIIAILLQLLGIVWVGGGLRERLDNLLNTLSKNTAENDKKHESYDKKHEEHQIAITKIKTHLDLE